MGPDVRQPSAPGEKEDEGRHSRRKAGSADIVQEGEAASALSDLTPGQRLMSGPDLDPPLDVTIELDVLAFEKTEPEKEEE